MRGIVQRLLQEETMLGLVVLAMAAVSPNIFPAAQAGYAKMSWLAVWLLLPSIVIMGVVLSVAIVHSQRRLVNRMLAGAAAGIIATVGLEIVRLTGFHFGWMPGDLAMLMGVLLTDQFMSGPSMLSNLLGYTYHYWNGVVFGIIFAVVFGRISTWWGVAYGLFIATGFLMGPAVRATGAGFMGLEMPMMPVTIYSGHLVFGILLGFFCRKWIKEAGWLLSPSPREVPKPQASNGITIPMAEDRTKV